MSKFNLSIPDEFEMRDYTLIHNHEWVLTSKSWMTILEVTKNHYTNKTFVKIRVDTPTMFVGGTGNIQEKWEPLESLEYRYNWYKNLEEKYNLEVDNHE